VSRIAGAPFDRLTLEGNVDLEVVQTIPGPEWTETVLTFPSPAKSPWPANDTVWAHLIVPRSAAGRKAPAVLVLPVMAAPNVIPMADIMLVLLIIFMVITPMLHKGVSVDMASATNVDKMQAADKDDAIIVAVTRDGKTFLGNNQLTLDQISDQIKDQISNRLDKTVYVRSDSRAKYGDVVKAVDAVRSAGVENLGLLTEKTPAA
jgi:biopolymer transport protein ExbD